MNQENSTIADIVRTDNWVMSKIPPLLAMGYGAIVVNGIDFWPGVWLLALLSLSICSVAAYGHIINDIFDIEEDRISGKKNAMARLSGSQRVGVCSFFLFTGFMALFLFDPGPAAIGLLALNYLLPAIYSVPPLRFKERGFPGVVMDALGAHTVPTLFITLSFMHIAPTVNPASIALVLSGAFWAFFFGLRGIIIHQIADETKDRHAMVKTFVSNKSPHILRKLVLRYLFPFEITALVTLLIILAPWSPILVVFVCLYCVFEIMKLRSAWKLSIFSSQSLSRDPYLPLLNNEFYEVWLPCALVFQILSLDLKYSVVVIIHFLAFKTPIVERMLILWRLLINFKWFWTSSKSEKSEMKIIIGAMYWTLNGVNVFTENMVRTLRAKGFNAYVLLTEANTELVSITEAAMKCPADIPFVELPVSYHDNWGAHWGAMIRYLEEQAPCIYIPNSDWRHSCVIPLLSKEVGVVGVVHSDDPLHYDHLSRLGKYWNAITTTSPTITQKVLECDQSLQKRIATIPIGVDIPHTFCRKNRRKAGEPLKIIYHGALKQYQKRVFDFPKIASQAHKMGLPIKMVIAGGGPDEKQLKELSGELVEMGIIHFAGVVQRDNIFELLESHDIYMLTSEFEGMPNALLEAMGRGCVPLVTDMKSAVPDLLRDGYNGYVVPIGDIDGFVSRLAELCDNPDQCRKLALRAYETVANGKFRTHDMVEQYIALFHRVRNEIRRGHYKRPKGEINHPPPQVDGVNLFPVDLIYMVANIGGFRCAFPDYTDFENQLRSARLPKSSPIAQMLKKNSKLFSASEEVPPQFRVIVSIPYWTRNGINQFLERLVRELQIQNIEVEILLTEENTRLINITEKRLPLPEDIPVKQLPVSPKESWGAHWGAMVKYLEEQAPCIYLPNNDWRHACISPLLSDQIAIIGTVYGDDLLYIDQARRLGAFWNAIVINDEQYLRNIQAIDTSFTSRTALIPYDSPRSCEMYTKLFVKVIDEQRHGVFRRPQGELRHPPTIVAGESIFPIELKYEAAGLGRFPSKIKDYRDFKSKVQYINGLNNLPLSKWIKPVIQTFGQDKAPHIPVVVASPVWACNGINEFSQHLVQSLRALDIRAHILLTEEKTRLVNMPHTRMAKPPEIPFHTLPLDSDNSWGAHWGAMIHYLEKQAPCIYFPTYDWRHSCVCPLLSDRVMIVGIVPGEDPLHFDHLLRLGKYWNVVVTYDEQVAKKICRLDPTLEERVFTIPYDPEKMIPAYLELFNQMINDSRRKIFQRPKGVIEHPPGEIDGVGLFTVPLKYEKKGIGRFPAEDPDYVEYEQQISEGKG